MAWIAGPVFIVVGVAESYLVQCHTFTDFAVLALANAMVLGAAICLIHWAFWRIERRLLRKDFLTDGTQVSPQKCTTTETAAGESQSRDRRSRLYGDAGDAG